MILYLFVLIQAFPNFFSVGRLAPKERVIGGKFEMHPLQDDNLGEFWAIFSSLNFYTFLMYFEIFTSNYKIVGLPKLLSWELLID